jgi:hypothetical protein
MFTGDKYRGNIYSARGFMASFSQEQLEIKMPYLLLPYEKKTIKIECG